MACGSWLLFLPPSALLYCSFTSNVHAWTVVRACFFCVDSCARATFIDEACALNSTLLMWPSKNLLFFSTANQWLLTLKTWNVHCFYIGYSIFFTVNINCKTRNIKIKMKNKISPHIKQLYSLSVEQKFTRSYYLIWWFLGNNTAIFSEKFCMLLIFYIIRKKLLLQYK